MNIIKTIVKEARALDKSSSSTEKRGRGRPSLMNETLQAVIVEGNKQKVSMTALFQATAAKGLMPYPRFTSFYAAAQAFLRKSAPKESAQLTAQLTLA